MNVTLPYSQGIKSGKVFHVGRQVALNAKAQVKHKGNMITQTRTAMDNIANLLAGFDATPDDAVKVTTFYQGNASAEALHENLCVRSNSYTAPSPATTGIPVPSLFCDDLLIEIEVIAQLD
ncbi:Endoribonuclease L-PSP [Roseobacter sp. SK209-2-6]|uniref:RidA family protein n=1 Tax=Roseobacter sp. SK209-2-6 TaxID=388739 RepID=UPI0000F3E74F|nr:RidA family protein [Roseobacter sp. SK209-2-6]EBA16314.1 Endoribonuclease L-PSP [Roseobacter sp. SK209-2-6]